MKFCQPHWDDLRSGVTDRGMDHLVAQGGEEAIKRVKLELEGAADDSTWDPLMAAHWAITTRAIECGGLEILSPKDDGSHCCPLCEADIRGGEGTALSWVVGCLNAMLGYAKQNGLMPKE